RGPATEQPLSGTIPRKKGDRAPSCCQSDRCCPDRVGTTTTRTIMHPLILYDIQRTTHHERQREAQERRQVRRRKAQQQAERRRRAAGPSTQTATHPPHTF